MDSTRGAVIFDMDGTLTRPNLDFDLIRAEIGIVASPILEAVGRMTAEQRARAEAILCRHESEAAATSELQSGAAEVIAALRRAGWRVALMTRNSRASTRALQDRHGLTFDFVRTREDGVFKPSPEPIFDICRALERDPVASFAVGDYHYDILCGKAAGATTVLLLDDRETRPTWAGEADIVIRELTELLTHLGLDRG